MSSIQPKAIRLKNNLNCTIRTATTEDAERYLEYFRLILENGEGMVITPDEIKSTPAEKKERLQKILESPADLCVLAECDGNIIGDLSVTTHPRMRLAHSCLFGISLHPAWRSVGLGSVLIQEMLNWATTVPQLEKICLQVLHTNTRAIALYKKFGFTEEGRQVRAVKTSENTYLDDILMARFIK